MLNIEGHFRKKFDFLTGSSAVIVARKFAPGTTARCDSFQKFEKISSISHDDWLDQYSGTPITRAGHPGLMRNARKILEEREDPSK